MSPLLRTVCMCMGGRAGTRAGPSLPSLCVLTEITHSSDHPYHSRLTPTVEGPTPSGDSCHIPLAWQWAQLGWTHGQSAAAQHAHAGARDAAAFGRGDVGGVGRRSDGRRRRRALSAARPPGVIRSYSSTSPAATSPCPRPTTPSGTRAAPCRSTPATFALDRTGRSSVRRWGVAKSATPWLAPMGGLATV